MTIADIVLFIVLGATAGLLAGVFGVGGGVLMVPAMVLLLGFEQHLAAGTSLLVIIPTAVVGTVTHWRHHLVEPRQALLLAVGGMIGAVFGGTVALSLNETSLRRLFVLYLVLVGVRLLWPPVRTTRPERGVGAVNE
jgi:uncharacterized protein